MKDIYIFSAGPGGRDVFQLINDINKNDSEWNLRGYVDTDSKLDGKCLDGLEIFCPEDLKGFDLSNTYAVCGVLDPDIREKIILNEILPLNLKIPSLVHPSAVIANDFTPQDGLIVFSGVNISYNVTIGKYVLVSFNCLVGHDGDIGSYSSLLPTSVMDGKCQIGQKVIIGSGAILHPGVSVGSNSTIGIGSVLLDKVPENVTIAQLPRTVKLKK
ncbi:MAG: hypothetical protein VX169_03680 [Pseudomonadota bacterium]|nr:hypothetical protein [Pseudomonadota bacterium]